VFNPPNPISVGISDIDPFGPIRMGPSASPGSARIGPNAGNLMGPDHPIFFNSPPYNSNNHPNSPFSPFSLPHPRYDPTGPVLGPHTDINSNNGDRNAEGEQYYIGADGIPRMGTLYKLL